jgi:hypothetical protein
MVADLKASVMRVLQRQNLYDGESCLRVGLMVVGSRKPDKYQIDFINCRATVNAMALR